MKGDPILGRKIKEYRKLHSMTQAELAWEIGVEPLHISNIENGRKGVSLDKLILMCECFHISLSDILPIEAQNGDDLELRRRWTNEIVHAVDRLDTGRLGTVKTMVCALLAE